ncbi:sensor histidine kinase [Aureisphaera galaxeae]|uniref:sensor histidine kinase n=1 Tax=Aureisphaera galaxeae TaxID=1538023 RepID=UPI0023500367|nr:histidine kinase [Aureisphaera galaxeae]
MMLDFLKALPLHLLFWFLVWLFFVYFFSYGTENWEFVFRFATTMLPITAVVSYVFAYYLIPRYLFPRRYGTFTLYAIYVVICSVFAVLLLTFINFVFLFDFDINKMPIPTRNVSFIFILIYLVVTFVSLWTLIRHSNRTAQLNSELATKLLEGKLMLKQKELLYLKQQIHPHFLFNTLNTVYGFALKGSKETPDIILKLSNLLDYILNQIDKPLVPIEEEVKHIESYLGLEEVRFQDTLNVIFEKDIKGQAEIPPMLLMPFVENAFKHGMAVDGMLTVMLSVKANEERLTFQINNTISAERISEKGHGLGIKNSKERLEALYPDGYTLEIEKDTQWHQVTLSINFENYEGDV